MSSSFLGHKLPFVLELKSHKDERGHLTVVWSEPTHGFLQENQVFSVKNTLRGLHFQDPPQGKLVQALQGEIYDVCIDIQPSSPNFRRAFEFGLKSPSQILWVPPGFAHGFFSVTDSIVIYRMTDRFNQEGQCSLHPFDPDLNICWPIRNQDSVIMSRRDAGAARLVELHHLKI